MKTYPKMKQTSSPWLGKIPEHWDVKRIKYVSKLKGRIGWQGLKSDEYLDEGAYLITGTDFINGQINWNSCVRISKERFDEAPEIHIKENDLLITKDGTIGKVAVAKNCPLEASLNSGVMLVRNIGNRKYLSEFLYHVLLSESFWSWFNFSQSGNSTILHLYQEQFYNFAFSLPPLDEQRAIAAYLDKTTAKIDGLIAAQEKLIELLAEKRKALISHVVTKGLNPKAKLKDSGISWLGKIPEHWEVKPIKNISKVQRGASPRPIDDPSYFDDGGEFSWVRISDVSASNGILYSTEQKLSERGASCSVKRYPGDLFLSIAGTVGKPCILGIKACIHDGFVYFENLGINTCFLYRIFEGGYCYKGLGKLGTQLNLNTDTIGMIRIPFPPLDEQRAIATYLDKATAKLDALAAKAEEAIALMKERRSALISAVVTGKVKVS